VRIALSANSVPNETIGPNPPEDKGRAEEWVSALSKTTNTPTRGTMPALEFVDSGNPSFAYLD
jgi:hypothetical protein